jgi:PilZ domain
MSATRSREVPPSFPGADRRRHPRFAVSHRLLMRWLECDSCHEEVIRAEDVSRGGARLVVRCPIAEGDVVFVQGWNTDGFESRAEVRRVYIGRDGQARIGVAFIDVEPPEHVLALFARIRPS